MYQPDPIAMKFERATRLYHSIAYTESLRPAQWQVLRFFANAPADQRTLSGCAHARATTMGTTSVTVTALVDRGFLERTGSNRNVGLRLTEKGRHYIEHSDPAKYLFHAVANLPSSKRQALDDALAEIIEHLEGADKSE